MTFSKFEPRLLVATKRITRWTNLLSFETDGALVAVNVIAEEGDANYGTGL